MFTACFPTSLAFPLSRFCRVALVSSAKPVSVARAQSVLAGFESRANDSVRALALQPDGKIMVGGQLHALPGNHRLRSAGQRQAF